MTSEITPAAELDLARLETELANRGHIAILWHIDDVKELRPDLTSAQCFEVLQSLESQHDAGIGLDLDLIEYVAGEMFPEEQEVVS